MHLSIILCENNIFFFSLKPFNIYLMFFQYTRRVTSVSHTYIQWASKCTLLIVNCFVTKLHNIKGEGKNKVRDETAAAFVTEMSLSGPARACVSWYYFPQYNSKRVESIPSFVPWLVLFLVRILYFSMLKLVRCCDD